MSDTWYTTGRALLQAGTLDWTSDPFRVGLVSAFAYKFSVTHEYLDEIPADALLGTGDVTSPTDTSGALSSATVTFSAPASAQTAHAIVVYQWTGDGATSALIAYIDSVIGLPAAPDGGPMSLVWPHDPTIGGMNYVSGQFGEYEGLRGSFQSVLAAPPCEGSVSRNLAF